MTDFPADKLRTLNELEAYNAMVWFLNSYWERRGKLSDDIAILMSDLSREIWSNQMPGDPASWRDWQKAVTNIQGARDQ